MPTDLKTVRDHPANLLMNRAEAMGKSIPASPAERTATFAAGAHLKGYEMAHDVTFAALDNDALERVREAYASASNPRPGYEHLSQQADADLRDAICDLLGLAD